MIPMGSWGNKDPDEKRLFGIDWSAELVAGDSLGTITWTIAQGTVTKSDEDNDNTTASLLIAGGVSGEVALINCHVITTLNHILEGTMRLDIRSR